MLYTIIFTIAVIISLIGAVIGIVECHKAMEDDL